MKAILAEAEEMQASSAGGLTQHLHPTASSLTPMHRQRSGDGIRVSFSLPKTHDAPPHPSSPGSISRSTSTGTPAWRMPNPSKLSAVGPPSCSPSHPSATGQTLARITPPGSMQVSSGKSPPAQPQPFSARWSKNLNFGATSNNASWSAAWNGTGHQSIEDKGKDKGWTGSKNTPCIIVRALPLSDTTRFININVQGRYGHCLRWSLSVGCLECADLLYRNQAATEKDRRMKVGGHSTAAPG